MNENIDLTKILNNCPKGTKLYSLVHGEVEFQKIELGLTHPIVIKLKDNIIERCNPYGKLLDNYDGGCILFPSKTQHDWSKFVAPWHKNGKFDPNTMKPFDKVLVYDTDGKWRCNLFSHIRDNSIFPYAATYINCSHCIPYNDDTKHLVGTIEEAPEYYRYWEK